MVRAVAVAVVACLALACLHSAFVVPRSGATTSALNQDVHAAQQLNALSALEQEPTAGAWSNVSTFFAGACLGLMLLVSSPGAASAEVEDQQIAVDGKGKTMTFSKEQLVRAKRLYNNTCAICHVGGGTRTNQNVGLSTEELEGAVPARTNINAIVAFLNNPTTYDGLYDISENHPSIKSADLFPKMRSMKQQDLYDMSAFILYNCQTIPEKWGGGKQYY